MWRSFLARLARAIGAVLTFLDPGRWLPPTRPEANLPTHGDRVRETFRTCRVEVWRVDDEGGPRECARFVATITGLGPAIQFARYDACDPNGPGPGEYVLCHANGDRLAKVRVTRVNDGGDSESGCWLVDVTEWLDPRLLKRHQKKPEAIRVGERNRSG